MPQTTAPGREQIEDPFEDPLEDHDVHTASTPLSWRIAGVRLLLEIKCSDGQHTSFGAPPYFSCHMCSRLIWPVHRMDNCSDNCSQRRLSCISILSSLG